MAVTTKTYGNTVRGEYSNVKETFPVSEDKKGIATTNTLVGGTGYTAATGVPAVGGTGVGCTVDTTVVAGVVTVVAINDPGTGYTVADTLTITGGNVDATFDVATLLANTISSVNTLNKRIIGVNTKFTKEIYKGDYIWFTVTDELVEVQKVIDDTTLELTHPVPTTATAVAYKVVPVVSHKTISWVIDAANSAKINEIDYPLSTSETLGNDRPNGQGGGKRLSPILIDSTGNGNIVYVTGQ